MNNSIHRISLDIHDTGSQVSISTKKGDTARSLYITLQENCKPYRITDGCYAVFTGVKADGNYLFNDCTIKDNVIVYDFTEQTVPVVGQVKCEIVLYNASNERITSPRFDIFVEDVVYNDEDIISSDEANALITATANAKAVTAEVEKKLANGEFNGDDYILTVEDKKEIADMVDIDVDQIYDPTSENAQSGIAVAQAIVDIETTANVARGEAGEALEKVGVVESKMASLEVKTEWYSDGDRVTLANNTEFRRNMPINSLYIEYPNEDFICSIVLELAESGNITITLPNTSRYIGDIPEFKNGQTWELNIKDGIVVGGLVE